MATTTNTAANEAGSYTPRSALAPMGAAPPAQGAETASAVLAAQAKALVEARFSVALHKPRNLDTARQRILLLCRDPGFSEEALYSKPMGKSDDDDDRNGGGGVEGLSIRFVEAALQILRNVATDVQSVYDDAEKRIVRVTVMDLEENVTYSSEVTVRKTVERRSLRPGEEALVIRERQTSRGKRVFIRWATDEEILDKVNALTSKAIREAGKRLIPADIRREAEAQIRATLERKDAEAPDAQKKKILDNFFSIGISADQVREFIGHDLGSLTPKELQTLRGSFAAIRDGQATWDEITDGTKEAPAAPPPAPKPKPTFCDECGTRSDQPVPHAVECSRHPDNASASASTSPVAAATPPQGPVPAGAAIPTATPSAPPSGSPDPGAAAEVLVQAGAGREPSPVVTPRGVAAVKSQIRGATPPTSGERKAPADAPARTVSVRRGGDFD